MSSTSEHKTIPDDIDEKELSINIKDYLINLLMKNENTLLWDYVIPMVVNSDEDWENIPALFEKRINYFDKINIACVAADNGDVNIIKDLVSMGLNISLSESCENVTPLMCASKKGHIDVIDYLLSINVDVNIQDVYGDTALHIACDYGQIDSVIKLIDHVSNINLKNNLGQTPLHLTTQGSRIPDIIDHLYLHGADINAVDNHNTTALMNACYHGSLHAVKKLISYGADVDIVDNDENTATTIAEKKGRWDILKELTSS